MAIEKHKKEWWRSGQNAMTPEAIEQRRAARTTHGFKVWRATGQVPGCHLCRHHEGCPAYEPTAKKCAVAEEIHARVIQWVRELPYWNEDFLPLALLVADDAVDLFVINREFEAVGLYGPDGKPHPLWHYKNSVKNAMERRLGRLGCTPSDRAKLQKELADKGLDLAAAFQVLTEGKSVEGYGKSARERPGTAQEGQGERC